MKINDPIVRRWTEDLPGERARLVRLCARLSGSYEVAEDLAQETLFEAWRQAGNLRDPLVWQSFVSGIARNVCLRWKRSHYREQARRAPDTFFADKETGATGGPLSLVETLAAPDSLDIETALEREERADILDQAMSALPADARTLLIERYVDELPQAEMAARRGMTENAVGVRIHRAKASLRRTLSLSPALSAEAAVYGLIADGALPDAAGWAPTRIWCPRCGRRHLLARFDRAPGGGLRDGVPDTGDVPLFGVRCPDCGPALGYDFTTAHPSIDTPRLLHGVNGYKPALNRLSAWWTSYYDRAVHKGLALCPLCGREARTSPQAPQGALPSLRAMRGLYISCAHCNRVCCTSASGIAFHHPAAQAFWRRNSRLFLAEEKDVTVGGRPAVAVRLGSRTSTEAVEIVLDRESFAPLHAAPMT